MATRAGTLVSNEAGKLIATWTGLLQPSSDVGASISMGPCIGMTVQLSGTLGTGGAVTMKGSNDGTNWGDLADPVIGTPVVLDAIGEMSFIGNRPLYIRPEVTAGDGATNLTVIVVADRT